MSSWRQLVPAFAAALIAGDSDDIPEAVLLRRAGTGGSIPVEMSRTCLPRKMPMQSQ